MNNVIQPGLERITQLLKGTTEFPWKAIHVAGTNGKGSICHYAAGLLRRRAIRAGKFSTPHLVNRYFVVTWYRPLSLTYPQMGLYNDQQCAS